MRSCVYTGRTRRGLVHICVALGAFSLTSCFVDAGAPSASTTEDTNSATVDESTSAMTTFGPTTATTTTETIATTTETSIATTTATTSGTTMTEAATTVTIPEPVCGNGLVEPGESCDGPLANGSCSEDCQVVNCATDFADCNDEIADGCEATLSNSPKTCGSCDRSCDSSQCIVGQCTMLVFASAAEYDGAMGGLDGADARCQGEADDAGLTGVYLAWLGDGVDGPATRFTLSQRAYVRPDGQVVADNFADLTNPDSPLSAPIALTLGLDEPPWEAQQFCDHGVWTNAQVDGGPGSLGESCDGWTSTQGVAAMGHFEKVSNEWTWWCPVSCSEARPIYCFQQPI